MVLLLVVLMTSTVTKLSNDSLESNFGANVDLVSNLDFE